MEQRLNWLVVMWQQEKPQQDTGNSKSVCVFSLEK